MKVGVTGGSGLIGWHVRCRLQVADGVETVQADRATLADTGALADFVAGCDAVVHLAGAIRGPDDEVTEGNVGLADRLVGAFERAGATPHLVYAGSAGTPRHPAYTRAKEEAGTRLGAWAERHGAHYTGLVLPQVFGEGGRPFHNSVVSTFCHQLAIGATPTVEEDSGLELLHAQDVADLVVDALERPGRVQLRPVGRAVTVSALLSELGELAGCYTDHRIPDLTDPFRLGLFNTLRSFLYPDHYPVALPPRSDERGRLVELVRSQTPGQTFASDTAPGHTRGNHFHLRKVERFVVLRGRGAIRIRRLFDDEVIEFVVDGSEPGYVDIPTLHTHHITNVGDDTLTTLFWANEIFDPERPDTWTEAT